MSLYVDKLSVESIGTKYEEKGKPKKNVNKNTNKKKRWGSFIANLLINVGELYPRCTKKKTTKKKTEKTTKKSSSKA